MSELISNDDAKILWAKGEVIQFRHKDYLNGWHDLNINEEDGFCLSHFNEAEFRRKPKDVMIGDFEIEPPKGIVVCRTTGSVGLVYGDLDVANKVKDALLEVFKSE